LAVGWKVKAERKDQVEVDKIRLSLRLRLKRRFSLRFRLR
jgi:hypothetical protein